MTIQINDHVSAKYEDGRFYGCTILAINRAGTRAKVRWDDDADSEYPVNISDIEGKTSADLGNRATIDSIGREIRAAADAIAAKYGLKIAKTGGTYSGTSFRTYVEFHAVTETGASAKLESDWTRYATSYGLKPEWYGKEFTVGGKRFRVTGLNIKAPKNCVKMVGLADGKSYHCPARTLIVAMGGKVDWAAEQRKREAEEAAMTPAQRRRREEAEARAEMRAEARANR